MTFMLLDEDDAISYVQKLLDLRNHWLVVVASPQSLEMLTWLDETFYTDGSLSILMVPVETQLVALGLGPKSNMSPAALAKACEIPEPMLRDVIITPDIPRNVLEWLGRTFHSENLN